MPKVIIDMTMALDGYVAGPEDGPEFPLGKHDGMAIFDWYFSGTEEYRTPLFKPEPGPNLDEVNRHGAACSVRETNYATTWYSLCTKPLG
jgi:hypothetical protein